MTRPGFATRWLALTICGIGCAGFFARPACAERKSASLAFEAVSPQSIQAHVNALAADMFEGRGAGARGGRAAGGYLSQQFAKMGLRGGGPKGSYFQDFRDGCRNVLGIIPGSDPVLKEELVLIGAHYDHVGYGSATTSLGQVGLVHNGADDNASGVAGLMELAAACRRLDPPPRRTLLFALWDCEETGLHGSKHWAKNPTWPLGKVALAINIDMIGRLRKNRLEVLTSRTAPGMRRLLSRSNDAGLQLDFTWLMKADSDHWSTIERNIPTVMFHTGLHDDYHKPSDDAEKINSAGIQQVIRLLFNTLVALDDTSRPRFRSAALQETPSQRVLAERPLPPLPSRLGVQWFAPNDRDGLLIRSVRIGSAASRGGLKAGDVITAINDQPIDRQLQSEFRQALSMAKEPVAITVNRKGKTEPVVLKITLDGRPSRLGLHWREDRAEPGSVAIDRVAPGSLAAAAGLRPSDRIYAVNNQEFTNAAQLGKLLQAAELPITFEVERSGRVRTVTLGPQKPADQTPEAAPPESETK